MKEFIVSDTEAQVRVDRFLADHLELSRSQIQHLLIEEKILINGSSVKSKYKVKANDVISVISQTQEQINVQAQDIPLNIVYEDEYLLVVDKKSGMVVHPAAGNPDQTLVNALLHHSNTLSDVNGEFRPGIVHRIDKDTSGLLIVAKTNEVHNLLAEMIKERTISRRYKAIVHGEIKEQNAIIKAPIGRDPVNRKRMTVTEKNSKYAETHVRVLSRNPLYSFIECKLLTGRTHQIRVHLKYIGHPLVGDPTYGPRKTTDVQGQALHAYNLGFVHPVTKEELNFTSELPNYFKLKLSELELKESCE